MLALLAGVAMYSVAGYLVAPRVIRHWVENSVATGPEHRLGVEDVRVNPFTLFISLTDVTLINEENKRIVSIARIETRLHPMERLQKLRTGFDVAIRGMKVVDPVNDEAILTVSNVSATHLVVHAAHGRLTLSAARLKNPELRVLRDAAGQLRLPAWLRSLLGGSPPASIDFDTLEVTGGTLRFTDHAFSPAIRLDGGDIVGTVARRRPRDAESMRMEFKGRFGESGSGHVIAAWQAPQAAGPATVNLAMQHIRLATLSPYFERFAGRGVEAGSGDLVLHYERRETAAQIDGRIDVERLQLADAIATDTGDTTPLQLVAALTTDETGRIDLSIPVLQSGDNVDPVAAIANSLDDYFSDLADTPFAVLAGVVGHEEQELGELAFPPGSAEITTVTAEKIGLLAQALGRRPLIALRARPAYDAAEDRNAIAAQQVNLHIKLATSTDSPASSTQSSFDFGDPKVRLILDEFAGARLSESRRLAISRRFESADLAYYEALYDALIRNEKVSETVLRRLARFRAGSVIRALAESGVEEKQLLLADAIEMTPSDSGGVIIRLEALPLQ